MSFAVPPSEIRFSERAFRNSLDVCVSPLLTDPPYGDGGLSDLLEPRAVVPDLSRSRPLTLAERKSLLPDSETSHLAVVDVVRTPDLLRRFAKLVVKASLDGDKAKIDAAQSMFALIVGRYYLGHFINVVTAPPNAIGTQMYHSTEAGGVRLTALHVDTRGGSPLKDILLSPRRLGIVEGYAAEGQSNARWVDVCVPGIQTLARATGRPESWRLAPGEFRDIVREYNKIRSRDCSLGEIVCISLCVPAGMAWSVPTDAVGHQGRTTGQEATTVVNSLTYEGPDTIVTASDPILRNNMLGHPEMVGVK